MTFSSRIARGLSSRRLPWVLGALAALIAAPALTGGLVLDDYFLRAVTTGQGSGPYGVTRIDAFRFMEPSRVPELIGIGVLPWWASPDLRLVFFRPLSSFSHWLDFHLFPGSIWAMHAVSLVWAAAAAVLATVVYRRLLGGGWEAGLAALFFALDPGHALSAGWLAARNAVLAAFFGLAALYAQDRWRRDGDRRAAWAAAAMTAASLASAEAGAATLALLAAHAWAFERPGLASRARALAPHAAVALVWAAIYRARGAGVHSGLYVDPFAAPGDFAASAALVLPINVGGKLGGLSASMAGLMALRLWPTLAAAGIGAAVLLAAAIWPILRREPAARFLAAAVVLAALPFAGTLPNDRNLYLVGFAGYGLQALLVRRAVEQRGALLRIYAGWILVLDVLLAAPTCLANSRGMASFSRLSSDPLSRVLLDDAVRDQTAVFVNPPSQFMLSHLGLMRAGTAAPLPASVRALVPGIYASRIARPRADRLAVHVDGGILPPPGTWPASPDPAPAVKWEYLGQVLGSYARGQREPVRAGDVFRLPGMEVEVNAVAGDGGPSDMTFTFDRSLDDPSLRWLMWRGSGYEAFPVPAVGQAVDLPAVSMAP